MRHGFPEGTGHREVDRLRERYGWLDHTLRMLQHYGTVNGNGQAGSVTYYGFLSVFPILALAFFVVGLLAQLYPDIKSQMVDEISNQEAVEPQVRGTRR